MWSGGVLCSLLSVVATGVAVSAAVNPAEFLYYSDATSHHVIEYLGDYATDFRQKTVPRVVEFYNPFCSHCKRYKSTYMSIAEETKAEDPNIDFFAVSCSVHSGICSDYSISKVPTVIIFPSAGEELKMPFGPRTLSTKKILEVVYSTAATDQELMVEVGEDDDFFDDGIDDDIPEEVAEEDDGLVDEEDVDEEDDEDVDEEYDEVEEDDQFEEDDEFEENEEDEDEYESGLSQFEFVGKDNIIRNGSSFKVPAGHMYNVDVTGTPKPGAALARLTPGERVMDQWQSMLKAKVEERQQKRWNLLGRKPDYLGVSPNEIPLGATTKMKGYTPGTAEYTDRREMLSDLVSKLKRRKFFGHSTSTEPILPGRLPFLKTISNPRLGERLPVVKRIVKMGSEEMLILDVTLSFARSLEMGLFKSPGPLSAKKKEALGDWFDLLIVALPPEWELSETVSELKHHLDFIAQGKDNLNKVMSKRKMPRDTWSDSCTKGDYSRALPCGFWKLLHVTTIGLAESRGGLNLIESDTVLEETRTFSPIEAADTIRGYIENFFHCSECAENFVEQYDDCERNRRCDRLTPEIEHASDADWKELGKWMWEFHNEVSVRILNEKADIQRKKKSLFSKTEFGPGKAEVDDEIKALWPSITTCVTCFNEDGTWNEDAVFLYLEKTYWPGFDLKIDRRAIVWYDDDGPAGAPLTYVLLVVGLALAFWMRRSLTTDDFTRTVVRARTLRHIATSKKHAV